ncbi:hypothetical protein HXX02_00030 [Microbulbifer elongatus]|uniref:Uncharacterized protein n=1 Tax=Microbulbifer elongatus TaxID=86173 RepID=A0ABT1NX03_9GAMM|nr:hypothetical protein [Microbulbifer elongatus]MCQ3827822.1 hypothetical protein [Microbulbifer elongatus]
MSSDHWETSYRRAVEELRAPAALDDKILAGIRGVKTLKPARSRRQSGGLLSKAASACSALAIVVVLLHPAQYIGAAPGGVALPEGDHTTPRGLERYRAKPATIKVNTDPWHTLRTEVNAGSYMQLCAEWRRQKHSAAKASLPDDLVSKARQHCRILP